ncbi:hypothetical protein F503_03776 [Ophiostoma piceae UAMH 11346]|uniref:ELYS-like domain-containing protein n=1 Tax=Ophiostoma piceae (strain UAMH 11346) TaxID=1262450 RepID=S3C0F1_OPHP1|nr:hypothetical protein F503_03776 [Ophiostoma piceae UAMH 11346]
MVTRLDYRNFQDVFGNGDTLPYDQHVNRDIESKRNALGGTLFIDRVFTALGIQRVKIYPPKDTRTLHDLYQQILDSKMSEQHKLSALYYLLLDHDEGMAARSKLSNNFASQMRMTKRYQIFMSGLWHMDRLQFKIALEYLGHPSLLPEFANNILATLVRHAEHNDYSLALAYYTSVQPALKWSSAIEMLFEALSRTDITEAFYFTRIQTDAVRQNLFEQLVSAALREASPSDAGARSAELISLPLDTHEENWLRAYLTTGEGRKLKRAKDTMIMKTIMSGDVALSQFGGSESSRALSGPWGIVLQGFRQGTTASDHGSGGGESQ